MVTAASFLPPSLWEFGSSTPPETHKALFTPPLSPGEGLEGNSVPGCISQPYNKLSVNGEYLVPVLESGWCCVCPRLKAIQARLDGLEGQLCAAERAAASSEAQRRAMTEERNKFQKQAKVCSP